MKCENLAEITASLLRQSGIGGSSFSAGVFIAGGKCCAELDKATSEKPTAGYLLSESCKVFPAKAVFLETRPCFN